MSRPSKEKRDRSRNGPIRVENSVATYIVERRLQGLRREQLFAVHRALAESSRRLSVGEERVRYVRSMFAPEPALCLCVFQATSQDLVRRVNEVAQVPFESIDEVLNFEEPGHRPE
jgi:Protein of unknown function (DUF4242)